MCSGHISSELMRSLTRVVFFLLAASMGLGQTYQTNAPLAPRNVDPSSRGEVGLQNSDFLRAEADLVLVPVTVTDRLNRPVLGLQKDGFTVFDQRDRQVIRYFSTQDAPLSVGILFDTSSSMRGKIERSREAVVQFLRTSSPEDEFFLVGFNDRPELLVNFTDSVEAIQSQISNVKPEGRTALLDAVYLGLDQMKRARNERKVLLIISDGGDNHSRYNVREVGLVILEAGVQIYALGIFDEAPRTKAERMGPDLLSAITGITGGRTFSIHNLKKLGDATDKLAVELRDQYLIAYRPSDLAHDGKWHKISVRVTPLPDSSQLRVHAKGGYYALAR